MNTRALAVTILLSSGCTVVSQERLLENDEARAAFLATDKLDSLVVRLNEKLLEVLPEDPGGKNLFETYRSVDRCWWADNWTNRFDLTGVAWNGPFGGTLVTPRHVVFASHANRKEGARMVFHDRDGNPVVRSLEEKVEIPGGLGPDLVVGRLDQDVPVKFYKVLPPSKAWGNKLKDALVLVCDKDRNVGVHKLAGLAIRRMMYRMADKLPKGYQETLIGGDSGYPMFLVMDGDLVLLSLHTFGGAGAGGFVSHPETFRDVNAALEKLGGGYRLTTVDVEAPKEIPDSEDDNDF